ncbi:3-hydroxyacyl-CoA dehydrogenase NAD-binding domain-containing protein [Rhizobium sp. TRM95796]|uniref:3-hydroxyacyl-CoA dehydrogenase NAD-binding domain-containing protein n=1 Tax=Rhizobium sp. TRM95796 TaxID=2979862 RepID=UPI0021E8FAEE|nr:3-hydroxyacyl-CoA dehydrogenase NAD-binding domain-containing protein [Rhizobium sp. TRM95796]MCV3767986.1 3-hydroxyacyl-CoA dehydrogenase NAD-binding domain-containing protein [Rhizobium sp. TRM95796]
MTSAAANPMRVYSNCVSGAAQDGVLVITIDNPPVNAASQAMREGLAAAIADAQNDPAIKAVVLTGAGRIFVGGADITEFDKPPIAPILPDICRLLENSSKPVIAALSGAALGGGLEIALACHYRIAAPTASVAFPEVKLGLIPGAGGTQRLPRLTGTAVAIDLIGSGRSIKAEEALSLGVIDEIAADPVARAIELASEAAGDRFRKTGEMTTPPASDEDIAVAKRKVLSKAKGQIAPGEAVTLIETTGRTPLADGLAHERAAFLELKQSPQSAALRHVFFAEREAGKIPGLEGVVPRKIEILGVVGAGLMGSGIAVAALDAGFRVTVVEQTDAAADKGRLRITGLLDKALASGRTDAATHAERVSRLTVASELAALADADLVIEAVFDDLDVKIDLFRRLDEVVRDDAILATNTSYLDPDVIAAATAHPERVLGLHFFSPAHIMRLVEVVRGAKSAPDVVATGFAVAKAMRKLPIYSGVTEGFIGNRIFSAYRREAEYLVEDGAEPQDVDSAIEAFGMAMGPFAISDLAGLEIAWARRKRQAATRDPNERYVEIADRLCEAGRFGQKNGLGWYKYVNGKRVVDADVTALISELRASKNIVPQVFSQDEILDRLLKAMADEGQRLLDAGVALRASDIDLVLINGYGFPPHKGGPMFLARS